MEPKINWIIHCVANGACGEGGFEDCMLPKTCNAHTHGMEQYGHLDFQLVLRFDFREVCRILNTLGLRVQAGEKFQAGDLVYGIYDDCQVRLDEYHETGRTLLRVVIPDKNNKFPEDSRCTDWYPLQLLSTEELMILFLQAKKQKENVTVKTWQKVRTLVKLSLDGGCIKGLDVIELGKI